MVGKRFIYVAHMYLANNNNNNILTKSQENLLVVLSGKLISHLGQQTVFSSLILQLVHLVETLCYFTVIAVIFCYCTVSVLDVGNCSIGKSTQKVWEMSVNFIILRIITLCAQSMLGG